MQIDHKMVNPAPGMTRRSGYRSATAFEGSVAAIEPRTRTRVQ
jgi:hypothetical protein